MSRMIMPVAILVAAALALAACTGGGSGDEKDEGASDKKDGKSHSMAASYEDAEAEGGVAVQELMQEQEFLETLADTASNQFEFPQEVPLVGRECGEANAYWSPDEGEITICYEMVADLGEKFADAGAEDAETMALDAMTGIFYHELGHATKTLFDLPLTGKEEDAVDQLSAVLMLADYENGEKDEVGLEQAYNVAQAWALMAQESIIDDLAYADVHSTDQQRMYNQLCWVYGAHPDSEAGTYSAEQLPEDRAAGCEQEYADIEKSWFKLLEPHLK